MGKRIRQSLLDDLWNLHGMRQASDIVFSGASAGGFSSYSMDMTDLRSRCILRY